MTNRQSSNLIRGKTITLRPAEEDDRDTVFRWLTDSDLTGNMLGPPKFPENPVPTREEFDANYAPHFFDGSLPLRGKCFIIEKDGEAVGQINSNEIINGEVEFDIWLAGSEFSGKGYGTDALLTLCGHLSEKYDCHHFYIAPSRKNKQAVRSYLKAGFRPTAGAPDWFVPDYQDTVLMVKSLKKIT